MDFICSLFKKSFVQTKRASFFIHSSKKFRVLRDELLRLHPHISMLPYDFEKKTRKRDMKKVLVGTYSSSPVAVNHKGETAGKR
jgi:hypothetical protein